MVLKIAFSVDDVNPTPGYGLLFDHDPILWLKKLNEEFGCKFTLFCIPMLDGQEKNSWLNNKRFCERIKETPYFEVAQHGLTHQAPKPELGAQEFAGLSNDEAYTRIIKGNRILTEAGFNVKGFKAPGWYITPVMYKMIEDTGFDYVADHFMGTYSIKQDGIYRVPYTFSAEKIFHPLHDDYLIIHSHINKKGGNRNGWTKEIYEAVRQALQIIESKHEVEYVTISELLEDQKKKGVVV